jgi:CDP-diacylglycerol--glycerol-3-phosphate 3-phosphatidyltransferase
MLNEKIRPLWDKFMAPVGRFVGRSRISPNAVTIMGLLIQIGAAALVVDGAVTAAGFVTLVAAIFDVLDGAVAKARGITSNFGAFLDSTTDRLADALYFLPIAWLYAVDPDIPSRDNEWIAVLALAAFMVSYVKARAESLGYKCDVGIAERAERSLIVIAGLVFDLIPISLGILAVASLVTVIQRIAYVYKQSRA